uniref:Small EDRK-rich factor-like N-terminal domain-containing protein n=1 Tax=Equus caballus TaxID=9796 RepID=A0A9L0RW39_HORSE
RPHGSHTPDPLSSRGPRAQTTPELRTRLRLPACTSARLRTAPRHAGWGPRARGWGGNQGELAHQKKMKKSQEINKGKRKEDSLTALRQQRVSEIMQQKQKEANEKKSMQTREK